MNPSPTPTVQPFDPVAALARMRSMVRDWRIERWDGEYPPGHSERAGRIPADIQRLMAQRHAEQQQHASATDQRS
jgi:hypothetical protein